MRCSFCLYPTLPIIKKHSRISQPKNLGEYLKRERSRRDLLGSQAAKLMGVAHETWVNWENNKTSPNAKDTGNLFNFLGFNPLPMNSMTEKMTAIRFQNGWTQEQAAKVLGVNEASWQSWEAGKPIGYKRHQEQLGTFLDEGLAVRSLG
jgi:DNA-binding XRE family transcriptional regulator